MPTASLVLTLPLAAVLMLVGGLAATTGLRGRAGTLTRDGRLGVRTSASLAGDDAFAVANRVAAPVASGAAALTVVAAVLLVALPLTTSAAVIVFLLALVGGFALLIVGGVLGDRAARHVPLPARRPASGGAGCGGCGCGGGGCSKLTRDSQPAAGSA